MADVGLASAEAAMIDIPMARAALYDRGDWSMEAAAYVAAHRIDMGAVNAHAGLLAVIPCTFDGRGFFNLEGDHPQRSIVIEALAEDAETVADLVAWPINHPERFAT